MQAIERIRVALDAASCGPWIEAGPSFGKPLPEYLDSVVQDCGDGDCSITICRDTETSDASYIAACNPTAMSEILAHIDKLEAENERLRKDAERYRWLRAQHWSNSDIAVVVSPKKHTRLGAVLPSLELLDETIDHMRKGTP